MKLLVDVLQISDLLLPFREGFGVRFILLSKLLQCPFHALFVRLKNLELGL
jgi:hypothetical protein